MNETKQIYAALSKVMGAVGAVGKDRNNPQQGYKFRGIDDVAKAVQPAFVAHGVVCVPSVLEREREVVTTRNGGTMASVRLLVKHTFYAADGSFVECVTLGEAMDSGDKASNKAMSAALKYALLETLCIPVDEPERDTEEHSPELAGKKSQAKAKTPDADDPMAKEEALLTAALIAARTEADIHVLRPRCEAFRQGSPERARLSKLYTTRLAEVKKATP